MGLDRELEEAIDRSQNVVVLVGRQQSSRLDAGLRRFAKQALEDPSERKLVPLVFFTETASHLPAIFR